MKILFLNTNIGYGGATKIMLWLAGRLSCIGDDVTFLTYRDSSENRCLPPGIKHVHLALESKGHGLRSLISSVLKLHKYIKANSFDLGIAFLSPSHLRLSLAAACTRTKVLLSQRGDPYQSTRSNRLMSFISSTAFRRANMFVFQTRQAMLYYDQSIQSRASIIPNPVSPLRRTSERMPDNRIVNVARLDIHQKRQDLLIDAFKLVCTEHPNISLHFYGDGEDEQALKQRAEGHDRIIFEGVTNNVVEEVQNARVFVLSSDFEGIPNALIEAMSLGVPCIATKCSPGGAELLIEDGINGLLCNRNDSHALASAIGHFLSDSVLAESCGHEAMRIVDTFSEDRVFSLWCKIIHNSNE